MYHAPTETLKKIVTAIQDVRKRFPNIKDDDLDQNGAIIYANGNDGTDFDWCCNDRLCEFMVYFREDGPYYGYGFIKVFVQRNDKMKIYVYADGGYRPTEDPVTFNIGKEEAALLAAFMFFAADKNKIWDRPIDELDLDVQIPQFVIDAFIKGYSPEDEDEEDDYEEDDY